MFLLFRSDLVTSGDEMDDEDVVIVHDTSPEYAQKTLENMKQEINKHIHQVRNKSLEIMLIFYTNLFVPDVIEHTHTRMT